MNNRTLVYIGHEHWVKAETFPFPFSLIACLGLLLLEIAAHGQVLNNNIPRWLLVNHSVGPFPVIVADASDFNSPAPNEHTCIWVMLSLIQCKHLHHSK